MCVCPLDPFVEFLAVQVAGEGPDLDGLWAVYSINKEDIGITFAPNRSLGGVGRLEQNAWPSGGGV